MKCNYRLQSCRKAVWHKCVVHRATCLSVKLVTCVQTLCYLQWVSFILFNRESFLASCLENRLSLLCNLLWWVGGCRDLSCLSQCLHSSPLQRFSNERHLLCNARHVHFGKCTWEYILVFKIIWYPLVVSSSHLWFGLTLYKWCGQNQYKTLQGQAPRWFRSVCYITCFMLFMMPKAPFSLLKKYWRYYTQSRWAIRNIIFVGSCICEKKIWKKRGLREIVQFSYLLVS